jgi:hypothetical protein
MDGKVTELKARKSANGGEHTMIDHDTGEVIGAEPPQPEEFALDGEFTGEPITQQYRRSLRLDALFAALSKAQGQFKNPEKTGENPHYHSGYATLDVVLDAIKEGCKANGLAVIQMPVNQRNEVAVVTLLGHSSGQWIESTLAVLPGKPDAQGTGSVITYLRRYALMALLGIAATTDDDAEAGVNRPESGAQPAPRMNLAADRACPQCGKVGSLILNRSTRQWVCWRSKGGCESSFEENDPKLTQKPAAASAPNGREQVVPEPQGQAPEDSFSHFERPAVATEEQLKPLLDLIGEATDPEITKRAILSRCNIARLADMSPEMVVWQVGELEKKKAARDAKRPRR